MIYEIEIPKAYNLSHNKGFIELFEREKLYLKPNLRLIDIAQISDIPTYEISKYISTNLNSNFQDFVNNYRVREAKKQISCESNRHLTLEAIGQASGFNSRSSFFRVFKKLSGLTPKQFKAKMKS